MTRMLSSPCARARAIAPLLALLSMLALSGCDLGSKSYDVPFYRLDYTWTQDAAGALLVTGDTDLPDGDDIEAIVTTSADPAQAIEGAILNGSTRSPGSAPVKKGRFQISLDHALSETCRRQPPCGPWPAGAYHLLLDARAPNDSSADVTTFHDRRYTDHTHGYGGFAGLELFREVTLRKVLVHMDENGHQVNPLDADALPAATPSPRSTP